jgi:cellulose biosynthesis protein BcsQ
MAFYLAVANRKGGVGKSTVSVMLAHALSVWGGKKILLIDLDSQCNASMILVGGETWSKSRKAGKTIADYFSDQFNGKGTAPRDYLLEGVGGVAMPGGPAARLSLLPGSLQLDDVQGDLFLTHANHGPVLEALTSLRDRFIALLRRFDADYDAVVLDCAPGLSFTALAALKTAHKVIVPFRPDYVSQHAVDRIALLIEEKRNFDELDAVPFVRRRYACLPNFVLGNGRERLLIEEVGLSHPMLATELPQRDSIANAFDWVPERRSMEQRYGNAARDVEKLYKEVLELMARRTEGAYAAAPA